MGIPDEFLTPILPPSRLLEGTVIETREDGYPDVENPLSLLDTTIPLGDIRLNCPALYHYLTSEEAQHISKKYLTSRRIPWYSQERRPHAPIICTYMGRGRNGKNIFRFFWNKSQATATNGYLLLLPLPRVEQALARNPQMTGEIVSFLRAIPTQHLIAGGRSYGGGLYKLEPKELGNVEAEYLRESIGIPVQEKAEQLSLAV
jgi:hypothetical protein